MISDPNHDDSDAEEDRPTRPKPNNETNNNNEPESPSFDSESPDRLFITAVIFELALGLVALVLGWTLGPEDVRTKIPDLQMSQARPLLEGVVYGVLAAGPILLVVLAISHLPFQAVERLREAEHEGILSTILQLRGTELIVLSLCAGVGEELLFRGWMMPWMIGTGEPTDAWHHIAIGWIGSSIAFGMVHLATRLYGFIAFGIGLYFGGLLLWSDNLLVPIIAHATYDAVQLLSATRRQKVSPVG